MLFNRNTATNNPAETVIVGEGYDSPALAYADALVESSNILNALYISDVIIESAVEDMEDDEAEEVIEATFTDVFKNIKAAAVKFFTRIKNIVMGWVKKVKDFFTEGRKFVGKYEKEIKKAKGDNYKFKSNWNLKDGIDVPKTINYSLADLRSKTKSAQNTILSSKPSELGKKMEEYTKYFDLVKTNLTERASLIGRNRDNKSEEYTMNASIKTALLTYVSKEADIIGELNSVIDQVAEYQKAIEKACDAAVKQTDKPAAQESIRGAFKVASRGATLQSEMLNKTVSAVKGLANESARQLKRFAMKTVKESYTGEEEDTGNSRSVLEAAYAEL